MNVRSLIGNEGNDGDAWRFRFHRFVGRRRRILWRKRNGLVVGLASIAKMPAKECTEDQEEDHRGVHSQRLHEHCTGRVQQSLEDGGIGRARAAVDPSYRYVSQCGMPSSSACEGGRPRTSSEGTLTSTRIRNG